MTYRLDTLKKSLKAQEVLRAFVACLAICIAVIGWGQSTKSDFDFVFWWTIGSFGVALILDVAILYLLGGWDWWFGSSRPAGK